MTRYVMRDGALVEKAKAPPSSGAFFMPDIAPFRTMEGVEIASRSTLRDYERRMGVRQVGTDTQVGPRRRER